MAIKKKQSPAQLESELLSDLTTAVAKWTAKGKPEYVTAFKHLLCAFTTPAAPDAKTK